MLNTIKGRLLSATKNVNLVSSQEVENSNILPPETANAGAEILKHFQDQWVELHVLNESNAKTAHEIAKSIQRLHDRREKEKKGFALLNEWLFSLPNLKDCLERCAEYLSQTYAICDKLEGELLDLEDLIEEVEFQTTKLEIKNSLKEEQLMIEAMMTEKLTINNRDSTQKAKLQADVSDKTPEEKQKIFQEAFRTDLENYKKSGTIPETKKTDAANISLEEIQIECSTQELEKFLDDT